MVVVTKMDAHEDDQRFARKLAEYDDVANYIILDSMLGFETHKMKVVQLPAQPDYAAVKGVLELYIKYGDEHSVLNEIISMLGNWWEQFCEDHSPLHVTELKEHVSYSSEVLCLKTVGLIVSCMFLTVVNKAMMPIYSF